MIVFLFGRGKKRDNVVITRSLYELKERTNSLFDLSSKLSPKGENKIYTTFDSPEPFLTSVVLKDKDAEHSKKLMQELIISKDQADELILAKKKKCRLMITINQLWITKAAKKAGVKTKIFR